MQLFRRLTRALGVATAATVALVVIAVGIALALVVITLTTSVSSRPGRMMSPERWRVRTGLPPPSRPPGRMSPPSCHVWSSAVTMTSVS